MADGPVDGEMIEIGDPNEDSTAVETPPQVVIQYHERGGVPWMLIPPLLLISAVAAVVLYSKFAPSSRRTDGPPTLIAGATPGPAVEPTTSPLATEIPADSRPIVAAVEVPAPVPAIDLTPSPTISPDPSTEPSRPTEPPQEAPPASRAQALGFDPKAFEAERPAEAPADPALAPAARAEQPREVDPDLLPPDPREARARQQQRRVDALKQVDDERLRFHADLKLACAGRFREGAEERPGTAQKIIELKKNYETKVDPMALKKATFLLGKKGKFVGADRRTRIDLLRTLGFPEPAILGDLCDNFFLKSVGERDGPRSGDEALYQSALMLLRYPPTRETSSARPVSAAPNDRGAVPLVPPGTGAGPSR